MGSRHTDYQYHCGQILKNTDTATNGAKIQSAVVVVLVVTSAIDWLFLEEFGQISVRENVQFSDYVFPFAFHIFLVLILNKKLAPITREPPPPGTPTIYAELESRRAFSLHQ